MGKVGEKNIKIDLSLTIPVITLNVNRLNTPIKRKKLSDWTLKNKCKTLICSTCRKCTLHLIELNFFRERKREVQRETLKQAHGGDGAGHGVSVSRH